jgi:hypothetical protein
MKTKEKQIDVLPKAFRPMGHIPTPVFCKKRLQAIENKRRELQKESQEISRGCNLLKGRWLRLEWWMGLARLVRDNTRKLSTSLRLCQLQTDKPKCFSGLRSQAGRDEKFKIRTLENHKGCDTRHWLSFSRAQQTGIFVSTIAWPPSLPSPNLC